MVLTELLKDPKKLKKSDKVLPSAMDGAEGAISLMQNLKIEKYG